MADIDDMKLRRLDLTTLMVFEGLMCTRKATRVAERLGVTQSSVSHALRRLRGVFGDELFMRRPHGLAPTAVAQSLEAPIRRALEDLRAAVAGPAPFEPTKSRAVLRIGAHDHELATLAPPLVGRVGALAPGMRVIARGLVRREALAALANAELDLAVGYFWSIPDEFIAEALYREDYAVVGRGSDALLRQRLTLKRYADARHIVVSPAGDLSGIVDMALEREGMRRTVIAATPSFFPALAMVAETGALATVPHRFAKRYASAFGLSLAKPPLPIRNFEVSAVRHRRDAHNAMHDWIFSLLREIAR
jgi:DNA-binding transcriptional LysR family regulator